jgi:hypothetical protein
LKLELGDQFILGSFTEFVVDVAPGWYVYLGVYEAARRLDIDVGEFS